jgi:ribose-phosphate pyrophosphokinase
MIETVGHLKRLAVPAAVCVAVHAVFAGNAYDELLASGAAAVVSCDTIVHPSNRISIAADLSCAVQELVSSG